MQFTLKHLAGAAFAIAAVSASAQVGPSDTIPFAKEPDFYGPDATIPFVDQPGYTDANATRNMNFDNLKDTRQLLVAETVIAFQVAAAVTPLITSIIQGKKKECQQVACWISTDSRTCAISVAERVQTEVTQGRDRYRYESIQDNGMWVRYWRTKFEPIDRMDIASGNCTDGSLFAVTNCQSTGRVVC